MPRWQRRWRGAVPPAAAVGLRLATVWLALRGRWARRVAPASRRGGRGWIAPAGVCSTRRWSLLPRCSGRRGHRPSVRLRRRAAGQELDRPAPDGGRPHPGARDVDRQDLHGGRGAETARCDPPSAGRAPRVRRRFGGGLAALVLQVLARRRSTAGPRRSSATSWLISYSDCGDARGDDLPVRERGLRRPPDERAPAGGDGAGAGAPVSAGDDRQKAASVTDGSRVSTASTT